MTYIIRDDNGNLKARISNDIANKIINKANGEFFKNSENSTCFRLKGDYEYKCGFGTTYIELQIWYGEVLIPE